MGTPSSNELAKEDSLFADESTEEPAISATELLLDHEPWNILIVDDDVDVHVVTKFALRDVRYNRRPLNFFHAYSGSEGAAMMRSHPHMACVLLDVVMENDHAGLDLARQIRGELSNHLVRIVLRTGQSGQALEQSIIVDYDVNDYRTKSELTSQKLFTTVITALRAYESLLTASLSIDALQRAQAKIRELRSALDHHTLFHIIDVDGKITHVNDRYCALSQHPPEELIGKDFRLLDAGLNPKSVVEDLWSTISQGRTWRGEIKNNAKDGSTFWLDTTIVAVLDLHGKPTQYLAIQTNSRVTHSDEEN